MIAKAITMSVRIPPRDTKELTLDEKKQLAEFFIELMDLNKQNVNKGYFYAESDQ